jgi:hypothetical protein
MRRKTLACLVLACTLSATIATRRAASQDAEVPKDRPPAASQVNLSFLPAGTPCTVKLLAVTRPAGGGATDTSAVTYLGKVADASAQRLVLNVSEKREARQIRNKGSQLPFLGGLFTNDGIRTERGPELKQARVEIPVESIQSITLVVNGDWPRETTPRPVR